MEKLKITKNILFEAIFIFIFLFIVLFIAFNTNNEFIDYHGMNNAITIKNILTN